MSWQSTTVGACLQKIKRPGKLKTKDYRTQGAYPIIDQGNTEVAGFTDQADLAIYTPLPITVFGDHTRRVKFVKKPFVCGADGTQLLYPNTSAIDPTFFYYAVKNIDLSSYFYARHFKFLKEQTFSYPDLNTQERISKILTTFDALIENNRRRIVLLEKSSRIIYREWFVHLRFPGHDQIAIINGIPERWKWQTFGAVCQAVGGGTPSTSKPEYWSDGDIPWYTPTDITQNSCLALLDSDKKITEAGLRGSSAKMLPTGSVLMTSRASVGYFGVIEKPSCTNQGFISILPNDAHSRMYLLLNLIHRVEEIRSYAGGATYKEINKTKFRALEVLFPHLELLREFEQLISGLHAQVRTLHTMNQKLTQARDLLLPRLMSREIVV